MYNNDKIPYNIPIKNDNEISMAYGNLIDKFTDLNILNKDGEIKDMNKNNEFIKYHDDNFNKKIGKYTFGLDKIIPWENSNFIFSGGLLFDILRDRFSQDLMDIDLFFYGSEKSKIETINKLLNNLDKNQYDYLIGIHKSVIYIFIQGIPRIIQLIMTNKSTPESIISEFDLIHLMFYTNGNEIYHSKKITQWYDYLKKYNNGHNGFSYLLNKNIHKTFNKDRIIKYIERKVIPSKIIKQNLNWILNSEETFKYLKNKKQIKFYKTTYNLTKYYDGENIDFKKIDKSRFDLCSIFRCRVNYNKLVSYNDFLGDIDVIGSFAQYMKTPVIEIVKNIERTDLNLEKLKDDDYYTNNHSQFYKLHKYGYCSFGTIYRIVNEDSMYIPCYFVNSEKITDDKNREILKMYFDVNDEKVIEYLIRKLNKYKILDALNCNMIGNELLQSKYEFDKSNIYMPFDSNMLKTNKKTIRICTKLYDHDINDFYETNNYGIFDELETKNHKEINCLFATSIILGTSNNEIKYLDVNLLPLYIFTHF